jgi:Na+-translocating ferredoxin:NAD+ oxidoreductase RnfD subunit
MTGDASVIDLGGRTYRVQGPRVRDPRMHVASVIITVQVLGQVFFHFNISIAQIVICLLTCALLEVGIVMYRSQVIAWPASALLTGNGVALILRVPGTQHGDWWSLNGWWIFAFTAAISLLSKYLIRVGGRPLFNPSNIGLVFVFLVLGPTRVEPLDFWWANVGPALVFALAVIVAGGVLLVMRVRMLGAALAFWFTFAACISVLAVTGHCMTAVWHIGPICDGAYWAAIVFSPEILIFMFFMITDPRSAPRGSSARIVFGAGVGVSAVLLAAPQRTEYATKVAVLGALVVLCALRPLIERVWPAENVEHDEPARVGFERGAVLAVIVVLVPGLVVVLGSSTRRFSRAVDVPPAELTSCIDASPRDGVIVRTGQKPTAINQPSFGVSNSFTQREAQQVSDDTVDNLRTISRALRTTNARLAEKVASQPYLLEVQRQICAARAAGNAVVPEYDFDSSEVRILIRRRDQAVPEVDVRLRGRVRYVSREVQPPYRVLDSRSAAFDQSYIVENAGDRFVIRGTTTPVLAAP